MLKRVWPGLLLLAALVSPLLPGPALAAQTLTATPTTEELTLNAGSSYSSSVKFLNTGNTDFGINVTAAPYSVHGEDYDQSFVTQPGIVDPTTWFSIPQTQYSLTSHQTAVVPFSIRVPSGAGPGGYYAVLFATTKSTNSQGTIKALERVGIIFYITVAGPSNHAGNVVSFTVPLIHTAPPLHTLLRMQNTGNIHFNADVELQIKDLFGNTKMLMSAQKIIMPGTIRQIPLDWTGAPGFGLFRVVGTVSYLGRTQALPDRFTLMLSSGAFVVMFLIVAALLVYFSLTRKRRSNGSSRRR